MYAKVEITGTIEVITGMHIGGSSAFAAIGAVDSPVIKDARTGYPMIPGSSLKGKMRTLLAKQYNERIAASPDEDAECIISLFGSAKGTVKTGRLLFSDMILSNAEELKRHGLTSLTEIKFENSIKRTTAVANPRQIERAVRGSEFPLSLIYEAIDEKIMVPDFQVIRDGLHLLQYDYLGGSGTRGYGKVKFKELRAEVVVGDIDEKVMEECQGILDTV
mgnify:FL=1